MSGDRISHWINTGKHVFKTPFIDGKKPSSTVGAESVGAREEPAPVPPDHTEQSAAEEHGSDSISRSSKELIGCENDLLIPTTDEINYTFLNCQRIWRSYITAADSLPSGCMPKGCLDPYALLQNIPPFPQNLPRERVLRGQALWNVPHPEIPKSSRLETDDGSWNPEHVYNHKKGFSLVTEKPIQCHICPRPRDSGDQPDATAILTLCWAYIFTIKHVEMQKIPIRYSSTRLTPVLSREYNPQPGDILLHLGLASRDLVRWLCALLAPSLGWTVKGSLPPWAAHYDGDTHFVVAVNTTFNFPENEQPPFSKKATNLLIEFCALNNLHLPLPNNDGLYGTLPQPTTSFLAALMLPFYNELDLQPQLPKPSITLSPRKTHFSRLGYIREFAEDIPYFMTLSTSVGSILWSIFWEPGLECTLTSAWFGSILEVISPMIESRNTETLSKIFAIRRPRIGLLWHVIFGLGDFKILDMIVFYLKSHEERWGGSWAAPDIDVAAWTGSPQSFFDEDFSDSYKETTSQVSRSDLLRHRFNFRLGDDDYIRFGWQPFGYVMKEQIQPELWPGLELGCPRKYMHWVWWIKDKDNHHTIAEIQRGYRHDKVKYSTCVRSGPRPERRQVAVPDGFSCKARLTPSFEATWSTLHYGAKEASGDRNLESTLIEGIRNHPWFAESPI